MIGGVAGGLGDYFNVDPLLFRIGFVGLMIFGGAGFVLYLIAWLLLPAEGHDASALEAFVRRLGITPRGMAWTAIAILLLIVIQAVLSPGGYLWIGDGPRLEGPAWIALVVVGVGIWLLRRRDASAPVAVASTVVAPPRAAPVPRPRSPLGWYVLAATLISVGLLAVVSQAAKVEVTPGQFFGAALTVIGIGLVVGAWWGRARILILLALLLLPLAVPASFVTAPLQGGVGDQRYTPANLAELRPEYRMLGGRLVLDLTGLSRRSETIHLAASVAFGELVVVLPENASVQLGARVGAGSTIVFDTRQVGTNLDDRYVRNQFRGATYILDLQAGIGEVQVVMQRAESN